MTTPNAIATSSYAASEQGADLVQQKIERRVLGIDHVQIDIDFCCVCDTDLHYVNNDWGISTYPLVPGHEVIGRVAALGSGMTDLVLGKRVGIGCMVDS